MLARTSLDYRVVTHARPCSSVEVTAYDTIAAFERGLVISEANGEAGRARYYRADLKFPILTGPETMTTEPVIALLDISADTHPFSDPRVSIVTRPLPWSPHVSSGGLVCIGTTWREARGRMLLLDLIAHVARFLNCDEPDPGPTYVGWNAAAIGYWRTVLNRKPVNPGLSYPVVPVELTHGVRPVADDVFLPASDDGFFCPAGGG